MVTVGTCARAVTCVTRPSPDIARQRGRGRSYGGRVVLDEAPQPQRLAAEGRPLHGLRRRREVAVLLVDRGLRRRGGDDVDVLGAPLRPQHSGAPRIGQPGRARRLRRVVASFLRRGHLFGTIVVDTPRCARRFPQTYMLCDCARFGLKVKREKIFVEVMSFAGLAAWQPSDSAHCSRVSAGVLCSPGGPIPRPRRPPREATPWPQDTFKSARRTSRGTLVDFSTYSQHRRGDARARARPGVSGPARRGASRRVAGRRGAGARRRGLRLRRGRRTSSPAR